MCALVRLGRGGSFFGLFGLGGSLFCLFDLGGSFFDLFDLGGSLFGFLGLGGSLFGFLGLGGSLFGFLGRGGNADGRPGLLADLLDRLYVIGNAVFVPILRRGLGLRVQGQSAEVGIIGARDDDRLPRGGDERLDQRLLVPGFFKHPAVQAHRPLPVLLVHEGQQLAELSQEFLFIDGSHLRLLH